MTVKFIYIISEQILKALLERNDDIFWYNIILNDGTKFRNSPFARSVTNIKFQQANRPSGEKQEEYVYFGGRLKIYAFKVEVNYTVLHNGSVLNCSHHFPGSVLDLEVFQMNNQFQKDALRNSEADVSISEIGLLCDNFPLEWAVFDG